MRIVFWLVGLFAVAAALALLMGQNSATVTLFWAPYRVDMSFNLVIAAVLLLFLLLHLALSSVSMLRALPQQAHRWRVHQRERLAHAALLDALSHQLAGRYVRARSAAKQVLDQLDGLDADGPDALPRQVQMQVLAHLLAAESSHTLQDHRTRDNHLDSALRAAAGPNTATVREGALLRAVRWAIEDRLLGSASRWLGQLPSGASRRTLALRLKLRVARLGEDHPTALDTARLLAKHKAFSATASRSLLRGLVMANMSACHDADQLRSMWKSLDAADRKDPDLVLFAVDRLLSVGREDADSAQLCAWGSEWVLPVWEQYSSLDRAVQERLVLVLQGLLDTTAADGVWLSRIERLQAAHPADPVLQYLAAQVCFRQQLWGKALALFKSSVLGLTNGTMRVQAWVKLAQLAEQKGDDVGALSAWREAALHLPLAK